FYCTGFGDIVQGFGGGRIAGLKVFQKHLLFRSTAWLMGVIQLAKPQVWNEGGRPCFAPGLASKFFCAEYRNTRPSRPPAPNVPFWAGSRAGRADSGKTNRKK